MPNRERKQMNNESCYKTNQAYRSTRFCFPRNVTNPWRLMAAAVAFCTAAVGVAYGEETFKFSVVYTFNGGTDGATPAQAPLSMDTAGNIHGTTTEGGNLTCFNGYGCGVVFTLTPPGSVSTLYTFPTESFYLPGVVSGPKGELYGANGGGGIYGEVYALSPAGVEKTLYDFPSLTDGVFTVGGVIRDPAGRYFASFVVDTDPVEDASRFPVPASDAEAGIDLGLTSFAVLSDGTVIRSPKFLRRAERKLRRLHKSLARKQPGSSNRDKARVAVARAHARVADSRRNFHHKTSTRIIRDNQAVYAEDLCVAGLGRTRLAKSVHDAGWSAFVNMLDYKARRHGRYFGKIGRWVPSTGPCSACDVNTGPKPLNVRQWTCTACVAVHDRDRNAAKNILALGRRERLNACGDSVSPPLAVAVVSKTGTLRGAA